jgi:TPR repeat protein
VDAKHYLGVVKEMHGENKSKTAGLLSAAAEQGEALAQYNLGVMFFDGVKVPCSHPRRGSPNTMMGRGCPRTRRGGWHC